MDTTLIDSIIQGVQELRNLEPTTHDAPSWFLEQLDDTLKQIDTDVWETVDMLKAKD